MKHLCEEQSVLELNVVCVFLKLSICLLNGTHTIFFFPLHYLLDFFFPEQNFVLALLFGTFCFPVTITSEPTPFKMFMGFLCYSLFLAFHLFGNFCLSFCKVVSAEVFFFTTQGRLQDLNWIKPLLLCTWLFSSHFIFCFMQTYVPQLKHLLAVLAPPLFHLDVKASPASCFSFQCIEGKPLGMSDQQLISDKSNIHFSLLFLSKGCGESG